MNTCTMHMKGSGYCWQVLGKSSCIRQLLFCEISRLHHAVVPLVSSSPRPAHVINIVTVSFNITKFGEETQFTAEHFLSCKITLFRSLVLPCIFLQKVKNKNKIEGM